MIIDMGIEGDITPIAVDSNGEVLPEKNDKIALIDADTIIFAACCNAEEQVELMGEDFYSKEEWVALVNHEYYDSYTHSIFYINIQNAYNVAKDKIRRILEKTGCQSYELHFTSGRKSFRYKDVFPEYKANRLVDNEGKRAPSGLSELKKYFAENEGSSFIWEEWEADDIVVSKKRDNPDKYLLVALDKDVLYSLEGTHFNYYERMGTHDMHFFDVDVEQAMKHHYHQTLTGDAGDGVPGLHRVGKKTADKLLADCTTKEECWDTVVAEYEKRSKSIIDAIVTMRLVNMHQVVLNEDGKYVVELWRPGK